MTLTIELKPTTEARLRRAAHNKGLPLSEYAEELLERLTETEAQQDQKEEKTPQEQSAGLRAMFDQWAQEDEERLAKMTPEEIVAEDAQWDEIMKNIKENRVQFRIPDVSDYD
jgi:hypothetical protein